MKTEIQQWLISVCLAWVPFAIGLSFITVSRSVARLIDRKGVAK